MALCFFVPDQAGPVDAEQLLRALGATGKLVGFRYLIYMIERVALQPEHIQLVTKCLYPETGRYFGVSANSVERSARTVVEVCWRKEDHSFLEHIAGTQLEHMPTNSEFIDMLAGYLRRMG